MSLEKQTIIAKIEIMQNGLIKVSTATQILENGILIGESVKQDIIAPGDDYSAENVKVQSICSVVHTDDLIAAYKAEIASQAKIEV